ncbi:hypothetical protein KUCAC02_037358 [Chaenocephalus aceratus]|nr:hypothetical protein KUCAC02_037358 [Chaenocephalus aceratus]
MYVPHPSLCYLTHFMNSIQDVQKTVCSAAVSKGAVNALSNCYAALEENISMNTKAITDMCEELKGVQIKVQRETSERGEDAAGYGRKRRLRLYRMQDCNDEARSV